MVSNAPGTVADLTHENYRALAISIWSIAPLNGPVTGRVSVLLVRNFDTYERHRSLDRWLCS
jgi:hypothetical protein